MKRSLAVIFACGLLLIGCQQAPAQPQADSGSSIAQVDGGELSDTLKIAIEHTTLSTNDPATCNPFQNRALSEKEYIVYELHNEWSYEYHVFQHDIYKGAGCLPNQEGVDPQPRFEQYGDITWLVLQETVGTGIGYADEQEVWYQIDGIGIFKSFAMTTKYSSMNAAAQKIGVTFTQTTNGIATVPYDADPTKTTLQISTTQKANYYGDASTELPLLNLEFDSDYQLILSKNSENVTFTNSGEAIFHNPAQTPEAFVMDYFSVFEKKLADPDSTARPWLIKFLATSERYKNFFGMYEQAVSENSAQPASGESSPTESQPESSEPASSPAESQSDSDPQTSTQN